MAFNLISVFVFVKIHSYHLSLALHIEDNSTNSRKRLG